MMSMLGGAALLIAAASGVALLVYGQRARGVQPRWRSLRRGETPVLAQPMGAYRAHGSVPEFFDGAPGDVVLASCMVSAASLFMVAAGFLAFWWGLFVAHWSAAAVLAIALPCFLSLARLDDSAHALLRCEAGSPAHVVADAETAARRHAWVALSSWPLLFVLPTGGAMVVMAWLLVGGAPIAIALYVKRVARRYVEALK
jgi:hypothetical protein